MIILFLTLKNKMAAISKFYFSIFDTKYSHVVHQMKAFKELNAYSTQSHRFS